MKNKFYLLAICILLFSKGSFASHAMGAELTYACLGPGPTPGSMTYRLTFIFYQDCAGAVNPPVPMNIDIFNSCGFANPVNVNLTLIDSNEINVYCPSSISDSRCNGGTLSGCRQWIYEGNVTLPGECNQWTLYHSEGVRNAAITTVQNPTSYNLYVYATINNEGGLCNNSPVFSNQLVWQACVGQQSCYSQNAFELAGDSLSYQLIAPKHGPNTPDTVEYLQGYSPNNPVAWTIQPMYFDPTTGSFCLWPSQSEVTILAILVNEYRNGILIGQIERDIQISVSQCNNNLPIVTGVNGSPSFNSVACVNQQNCFLIKSIDPDVTNTTTLTWDNNIPNATFTTTGGHRDSAYFCWTPSLSDTSQNPYCFNITASDDNCPYLGLQVRTFCITVDTSSSCHSTGLHEKGEPPLNLRVYPQPASDMIYFDFGIDYTVDHKKKLFITDFVGRTIYHSTINEKLMRINVSELSSGGMLFAYVVDESGRVIERIKLVTLD